MHATLRSADSDKLEASLQSKIPRQVVPRTTYWIDALDKGSLGVWSDSKAGPKTCQALSSNYVGVRKPDAETFLPC